MATCLMFHHFWNSDHPAGQGAITAREFDELIERLGAHKFLPAREWAARAESGKLTEDDLCISFDDGLRCQFDLALPVLESRGLTAFWFVYSSVFEGGDGRLEVYRWLRTTCFDDINDYYAAFERTLSASPLAERVRNALGRTDASTYRPEAPFYTAEDRRFRFLRDEVLTSEEYYGIMDAMVRDARLSQEELAPKLWMDDRNITQLQCGGHLVGLHSYSHPTNLPSLSDSEIATEYRHNHAHLSRVLGESPFTASHPCGRYNEAALDTLRQLGIRLAFCADMKGGDSLLELPRLDHAVAMRTVGLM